MSYCVCKQIKGEFLECGEDVLSIIFMLYFPSGSSREMFVNQHICELIFQNQYENKIMWKLNLFMILIFFLMIILKTMFCQEKSCDKK